MMIEPKATLQRIWQIAHHIPLGDRDLTLGDGKRARKENPSDL
jgi:hypothetical protein